jgi:hypothetical protein
MSLEEHTYIHAACIRDPHRLCLADFSFPESTENFLYNQVIFSSFFASVSIRRNVEKICHFYLLLSEETRIFLAG